LQSKLQLNGYYSTFYYSQVKMTEIYLKTMQKLDEQQNFTYSIVFFSAGGANKYKTIL